MALKPESIRKIIFDLDDTLFDTQGQLIHAAVIEAIQAMIRGGLNGTLNECLTKRRDLQSLDSRKDLFTQLVEHFRVQKDKKPEVVAKIGFEAFHNREIKESIHLFPEVPEMLGELQEIYDLFLVTMGSPYTQKKKIEILKLSPYFLKIIYVDVAVEKSKTRALQEILSTSPDTKPENYLSVGNRIDSEIRDAKSLGMQTVLILHGEHVNLVPQGPHEEPDERISKISDLMDLL